jgi:hypothetical protein
MQPGRYRRPAVVEHQSPAIGVQSRVGVGGLDVPESVKEPPPEVPRSVEALAELLVQHGPSQELRLTCRDTMQPLGEPNISIECHRGTRQDGHRSAVEWYGVPTEALEIFFAESHG